MYDPNEPYHPVTDALYDALRDELRESLLEETSTVSEGEEARKQLLDQLNQEQCHLLLSVVDGKNELAEMKRRQAFSVGLSAGLRLLYETSLPPWQP